MSKINKREPSQQFSVSFPKILLEEIDTICASNYISRTAWLLKAAKEKILKERKEKTITMLENLEDRD